ncbi:penicillin-binding transpeptidase domain-containing protein [Metabacillus sp. GX 13764]|uniref:penicillin-binding transpeptidase domain-containing protein n=1 Tax=Metabacillus kandeliae TaxID=2900151 RepID=UPI001E4510F8|nr:penicillin-binding transpeptidase domain-containing protein [Metabacillus kandeliae]MCD7035254.1 penicillin-binding transpeptidase domain-containing protein [Metabacillus kandeliae]
MKKTAAALILSVLFLLLAACTEQPKPEDKMQEFTKLWNSQKFGEMYDDLSADVQKKISKEDFVSRYQNIYSGTDAKNLAVTYIKPKEPEEHKDEKQISLPFTVKMDTAAGPVSFQKEAMLVKEEKDKKTDWYVKWDPSYILPGLKGDEKVSVKTLPAERGQIYDRNGKPLAVNGQIYQIGVIPAKMKGKEKEILASLSKELQMTEEDIQSKLNQSWVKPDYFVPLKEFSLDEKARAEKLIKIPAVQAPRTNARVYPYKESMAHLVGYIGSVTKEDLDKHKEYRAQDKIGKRGLEQVFEQQLKGANGTVISIKDDKGQEKIVAEKKAVNGKDLNLTIDAALQQQLFTQLNNEPGSAAAINPLTGETLALVSSPSFDPNHYIYGMTAEEQQALTSNPNQPLLNRFGYAYAPGSTLKPLTAGIALENGIDPNKTMDVKGLKWQKDSSWGNYFVSRVHEYGKPVGMTEAMIISDNIYFAQKALELGKDSFSSGLKKFGFEEKLPFAYPVTSSKIGSMNSEVQLADSGYGQGQVQMSSLHVALAYTAFVNNGSVVSPTLIKGDEQKIWKENAISKENANKVMGMMQKVISDPKGTAHELADLGIPLAGKTGTAEFKEKQGEKGKENGWMVAVNTDQPKLLTAMMIENVQNKGGSLHVVKQLKPVLKNYLKK